MSDKELLRHYRQTFRLMVGLNDWHLVAVDDEDFAGQVMAQLGLGEDSPEVADEVLRRAIMRCYCLRLYTAFGQQGSEAQRIAMREAKDFVLRRLLARAQGDIVLADECAQKAIEQAWLKWGTIRTPGSFLGYVLRIGIHELLSAGRQSRRLEDVPDGEGDPRLWARADTETRVVEDDLRAKLRAAIRKCLQRAEEARLIIEIFLEGRSYHELAISWGCEASYLHLLKFRAIRNLKACGELLALQQEWALR